MKLPTKFLKMHSLPTQFGNCNSGIRIQMLVPLED